MPNIWTHICFCENVVDAISNPNPFMKQESMMKLGAQGLPFMHVNQPTFSFHHRFSTDIIYSEAFITDLIESAKDKSKNTQAYVFGLITNYILEQQIASFVYARGGKSKKEQDKLKMNMDTVLMKKYHNLETWKVPVHKEIDVGLLINREVIQLLQQNVATHYQHVPLLSSRYIQTCYIKLKWKLVLTNDPYGWKKALFSKWITPYSPNAVKDNIDYLNLHKKPWEDAIEHVMRTDSFEDLYEQARLKAMDILSEVSAYWQSNNKTETFKVSQSFKSSLTNRQHQLKYQD